MHTLNSKYSIKDLERLSGVKAHTIRIWEQRYNLLNPDRTETNIRLYSDQDLKLLMNVSLLLQHGGKISHLSKLSFQEISQKVNQLATAFEGKDEYFTILVNQLIQAMLEFDDARFEKTLSECTEKFGFELTMLQVLIPFLNQVGMMWLTGESSVLQEHFISNLIRKKLIVAIDSLPAVTNPNAERFLLFLPEGELHEIGLLFSKYLLKKRGRKVIYLGQTVPREDIRAFCKEFRPNYLLTFFTAALSVSSINEYLLELHDLAGTAKVLVAGMQIHDPQVQIPDGIHFITSVMNLLDLLEGRLEERLTGTRN